MNDEEKRPEDEEPVENEEETLEEEAPVEEEEAPEEEAPAEEKPLDLDMDLDIDLEEEEEPEEERLEEEPETEEIGPPDEEEEAPPPPPEEPQEPIQAEVVADTPISIEAVPLHVVVEAGRIKMSLQQLLDLSPGNLLELGVSPDSGVNLVVEGKVVGRGELIKVGDSLGVRILEKG